MAEFVGVDFVIQLEDQAIPATYNTIACQRSTSGSINNEVIDVTSKCNMPWRTSISGGIQSMSLSCSGVFTDGAAIADAMDVYMNNTIANLRLISGYGDIFQGPYSLTSLERSGEYNDAEMYSMSMESAGVIVYTPPP